MPETLSSLIEKWQRERAKGRDVPAAELCGDQPHQAERLERILAALRADDPPRVEEEPSDGDTLVRVAPRRTISQPYLTPPGYEVVEVLGRGGMGIVYKAKQLGLDRVVALKMILAGSNASGDELARFQAEAQAVAALHHPGIVQVYQAGTHDGLPFLAMELCPGGSLADRLHGSPLPPAEAARIAEALARAIEHAHRSGVVHRDLKPANVLLDADGEPKVTDFGLAKRLQRDDVTVAGVVMGTPSYMPPEQAQGGRVGPAADVYSLGATLYECLTGLPPFRAATRDETLRQVMDTEPVPVRTLQPRTPRDLETICHKCLSKDPRSRYPSAGVLADDLARFRRGEPILARPVGSLERLGKWVRRRPTLAALWLAIVLLMGGMLALWTVLTVRLEGQRDEANRQRDAAREETARADWFRELVATELEDPFGNDGGVYRVAPELGGQQTFIDTLERARRKADLRLGGGESAETRAAVLDAIGNAYVTLGQHDKARECLTEALSSRESRKGAKPLDHARSLHSMGKFHHERGRLEHGDYEAARSYYSASLAVTEPLAKDPAACRQALTTRFLMAWLANEEERLQEAVEGFDGVEDFYRRHVAGAANFDAHHLRHADRLRALARVGKAAIPVENAELRGMFTFVASMDAFLAAIQGFVASENDEAFVSTFRLFEIGMKELSGCYDVRVGRDERRAKLGRAVEALGEARVRLARDRQTNQLYYGLALLFLGEACFQLDRYAEAASHFAESLEVSRRSVGYQHYKVPYVAHQYGEAMYRTGRLAEGRETFDRVMEAVRRRYGGGHYIYANALMYYGDFLRKSRQYAAAEDKLREALGIYQKTGGPKRKFYHRCVDDLCDALARQNKHDEVVKVRASLRGTP